MSTQNQPEWGNKIDTLRLHSYEPALESFTTCGEEVKDLIRSFALTLLDETSLNQEDLDKHEMGHSQTLGYEAAREDLKAKNEAIKQKYGL